VRPIAPGEEAYLKLEYHMAPRGPFTNHPPSLYSATPLLATQTLPLTPWGGDIRIPPTGELSITDSNNLFTVSSPNLSLSFDKETGWIRQYTANGQALIADGSGLRPALSSPPHLQLFSISTGIQMAIVRAIYTVPEFSCLLHLSYTVNSLGTLLVEASLETDTIRQDSTPHLVGRFGMIYRLPSGSDSITWFGFAARTDSSQTFTGPIPAAVNLTTETDRIPTLHHSLTAMAATNDNGSAFLAMQVRWFEIRKQGGNGFRIAADSSFLQKIAGDPDKSFIDIFDRPDSSSASYPIRRHLAFRITALPIFPHRPAKPI
jgi:hypothetical protein